MIRKRGLHWLYEELGEIEIKEKASSKKITKFAIVLQVTWLNINSFLKEGKQEKKVNWCNLIEIEC